MVKSPDGKNAILIGCYECEGCDVPISDKIFELKEIGENLVWEEMKQKIQHPRTNAVAMLIPDELTNCTTKN